MSYRYIPTKDSKRQQEQKWINGLCHLHGIFCDCSSPLEHTTSLIFEKEPTLQFSVPEKQLIEKCLSGEGHTTQDGEGTIGEGDLDALFGEPFVEEDTTG